MKFKSLLLGLGAAMLISSMPTLAQAKSRLLVNCFWPPKHHVCSVVLPEWLAAVEQATEGRVTGRLTPKSVAPPPEQLAAVEKGLADVSVQFNGLIQNRIKGPVVAMQPFVGTDNASVMSQALWETNQKFFPDEFDTVQLLSQFVISPGRLFSYSDTPIVTLEDFSSRKIWSLPGPLAGMSKALGAGVVSSPAVKSNEIISRGIVDGFFGLDAQAVRAFQLMSYTKSNTKFSVPVYTTSFSMFINKDKWAEISVEDQAAISKLSGAALGMKFGSSWDQQNADAEAGFAEAGITIVEADPAFQKALVDAAVPITKKWIADATAAGIDAQGALDFYKQRVSELSSK